MAKTFTDALYYLWTAYCFILATWILFAGLRLVKILKQHLDNQNQDANSASIHKIKNGLFKVRLDDALKPPRSRADYWPWHVDRSAWSCRLASLPCLSFPLSNACTASCGYGYCWIMVWTWLLLLFGRMMAPWRRYLLSWRSCSSKCENGIVTFIY